MEPLPKELSSGNPSAPHCPDESIWPVLQSPTDPGYAPTRVSRGISSVESPTNNVVTAFVLVDWDTDISK